MGQASNLRRRLNVLRRRSRRSRKSMTVIEHLDELRSRLIKSVVAFVVISVAAFFFFEPILKFLLEPLCELPAELLGPQGCRLIGTSPTEPFQVRLKVTALAGIVFSAPVWLYQIWAFVTPGLTTKEKRYAIPFVVVSALLFAIGTTFAYLTLRPGLRFLIALGEGQITSFFQADRYLNFVGFMFLGFGAAFELPLLLFFLGLADVVSVDALRHHRRSAIVAITFIAAIVTPSQDPYTMMLMAVPLYLMYELVILLLRIIKRRRAASI